MGLFNNLKNKNENQPNKEERKVYSMPSQNYGEQVIVLNIEKINSIMHRNGETTDLFIARILKQNPGETIYVDNTDYIAFEIPQDIEINDEIMQIVMKKYDQNPEEYIGRLIKSSNEYIFGNKSSKVDDLVQQTIQQNIQRKIDRYEKSRLEHDKMEKNKRQEFLKKIESRGYLEKLEEEKNMRIQSPILKRLAIPSEMQKSKYSNYDGVNLETGDILRLRRVDKVGKDGSGTYLYSAYISNTPNEYDVEMIGDVSIGIPVCFELQKRLEDIVSDGNINEIVQVLKLLSDKENFKHPEQLTYIGEVDKNGQVNRREESTSSAIQLAIIKMQKQFAEKIKDEEQGR